MSERFVCPPEHKHAETSTCRTAHGCRCAECVQAHTEYEFWRRAMVRTGRRTPNVAVPVRGTRRRLQALMTLGWSQRALAARLGTTQNQVWLILERQVSVTRETAEHVAEVYEQLWNVRPPAETRGERASVGRASVYARRRGFAPPMAWDDIDHDEGPQEGIEVDVDEARVALAVDGVPVELTTREREEAVRALNARGLLDTEIARTLSVAANTVLRIRQRLDLPERFNQINGRPGYRGEDAA